MHDPVRLGFFGRLLGYTLFARLNSSTVVVLTALLHIFVNQRPAKTKGAG